MKYKIDHPNEMKAQVIGFLSVDDFQDKQP